MKIGIIAAMHLECEFFRAQLINPVNSMYLDIKVTHAHWAEHEICLLESGIGKVNATLAAEWLAREFNPNLIINTGSAGGIKEGVNVGDFVIADQLCQHDIDVSPIGFEFGELPRLPVYYKTQSEWLAKLQLTLNSDELLDEHHIGTIATGESFIYRESQVELIKNRFTDVIACEMEAGAVAQVCHLHEISLLVLRNISDVAGEDAQINFNRYIEQAGEKSTSLVLKLITSI